jgi:hypothetical protein
MSLRRRLVKRSDNPGIMNCYMDPSPALRERDFIKKLITNLQLIATCSLLLGNGAVFATPFNESREIYGP